jgi:hypothetical protein
MRKRVWTVAIALAVSSLGMAQNPKIPPRDQNYRTVKIPAKEILEAARTIQPQTSPFYTVKGVLACSKSSRQTPLLGVTYQCEIRIGDKVATVNNPKRFFRALQESRPMTRPVYRFEAEFSAESSSRYTVVESAAVHVPRTIWEYVGPM